MPLYNPPASGGASVEYPWRVEISPETDSGSTNWPYVFYAGVLNAISRLSSGGVDATIQWDIVLGAGTWTMSLIHGKNNDNGIFTVALGGSTIGTIDAYAAGSSKNNISTITGIVVAESTKKVLQLTMATKNASSAAYYGEVQFISFHRTA